jgi:hypothetical protein
MLRIAVHLHLPNAAHRKPVLIGPLGYHTIRDGVCNRPTFMQSFRPAVLSSKVSYTSALQLDMLVHSLDVQLASRQALFTPPHSTIPYRAASAQSPTALHPVLWTFVPKDIREGLLPRKQQQDH